jgi:hypothetical protein
MVLFKQLTSAGPLHPINDTAYRRQSFSKLGCSVVPIAEMLCVCVCVQATLGHHLYQVAQAQFEPKVPAHIQNDDIPVKVSVGESCSRLSSLPMCGPLKIQGSQHSRPTSLVCTRALKPTVGKQPVDRDGAYSFSSDLKTVLGCTMQ